MATAIKAAQRQDAVFIRRSGDYQDDEGQAGNCKTMLADMGVVVADEMWFSAEEGVRRKDAATAPTTLRLMELVEQRLIGTIYIEKHERWGSTSDAEYQQRFEFLRKHGSQLYDLRRKKVLSGNDLPSKIQALIDVEASKEELRNISNRTLRTKVDNLKELKAWPSGKQPFGFAKACYENATGKLLWVWEPTTATRGQVFRVEESGERTPGFKNVPIPPRSKAKKPERTHIRLIPSSNAEFIATIKLVFELYARDGMSRRQIAIEMNRSGRKFYNKPFTHSLVIQILSNAAYIGDTHYGKTQTADYYTANADGLIEELPEEGTRRKRGVDERVVVTGTHEGIVDRDVWDEAQERMRREAQRTSHASKNPSYYLKPILVCGHCGKNMTGTTETDGKTGNRKVVYYCSTYKSQKNLGREDGGGCLSYRIGHDDAERMLFDKIAERQIEYDVAHAEGSELEAARVLRNLEYADDAAHNDQWDWVERGVADLIEYFKATYSLSDDQIRQVKKLGRLYYNWHMAPKKRFAKLPFKPEEFKAAILKAEAAAIENADRRLKALRDEHAKWTESWVMASAMQKPIIKTKTDKLEQQIKESEGSVEPLSARLRESLRQARRRQDERDKLLAEWPMLKARQKGAALQNIFDKVTLFWTSKLNPRAQRPGRPRKTNREGRYSHKLDEQRIGWDLNPKLGGSW